MKPIRIEAIPQHLGEEIGIEGWLYHKRSSGAIQFLLIRDGSGLIQAVGVKKNAEAFQRAESLTQESSIRVWGQARVDARAPTGYELEISKIEVIQLAPEFPIALKEHGPGFLMDHRHLWIRSPKQAALLRIRHEVLQGMRDFFDERDFIATESPILTPAAVEGTTTLFPVDYFGEQAFLSQSGQLYLEATAMALGLVYWIGPAFRAEKSKTRKHLTEFWMCEAEMAFYDHSMNMQLQEDLVKYLLKRLITERAPELKTLERDTTPLEKA
jgi:asparaginyl-tRNA synthetase